MNLVFWSCAQEPEDIDRANALLNSGDEIAAIGLYEQIIRNDPGSLDAEEASRNLQDLFLRYANGLAESDPETAIKLYNGIKNRWENSRPARTAQVKLKKMNAEGVMKTLPLKSSASFGDSLSKTELLELETYQKTIIENPNSPEADESQVLLLDRIMTISLAYEKSDIEKALKLYKAVVSRWPDSKQSITAKKRIEDLQSEIQEPAPVPEELGLSVPSKVLNQTESIASDHSVDSSISSESQPSKTTAVFDKHAAKKLDALTIDCEESQKKCDYLAGRFKQIVSKKKEQEYLITVFYNFSRRRLKKQSDAILRGEAYLKKRRGRGDDVSSLQERLKKRCGGCVETKRNFDELHLCRSVLQNPTADAVADYKQLYPSGACYDFSAISE